MTTVPEGLRDDLRVLAVLLADLTDEGWTLGRLRHELRSRVRAGAAAPDLTEDLLTDLVLAAGMLLVGLDRAAALVEVWDPEGLAWLASRSVQVLRDLPRP